MHKILPTILFLLCCHTLQAQTIIDTTKVPFVAYWSVGDSYDFRITKVKKNYRNGKQTKKDSSQYVANFKVLDSTAKSYKIQWTYTNKLVSTLSKTIEQTYGNQTSYDSILQKYRVANIIYTTNELGEFESIENWQEISDLMSGLFDQVKATLKAKSPDKYEKIERLLNPVMNIYSSKQGIEQLVTTELQYFHYPFGLEYDVNEPLKFEEELPNMLGGKPLSADAVLSVEAVDFDDYFCVLKETVVVDPEETKALIKKFLKKTGLNSRKMKSAFESAFLDIKDTNIYEFYFDPGVPHKITAARNAIVKMNDISETKNETLLTIELIYDDEK